MGPALEKTLIKHMGTFTTETMRYPGPSFYSESSSASEEQPFVNPNPHGGQKRAAGHVYTPRIYGFKVSERAKSGPRMKWLRLRPQNPSELELVDWRGRWIDDEDEYDEEDEEAEEDRQMEDFDPVRFILCLASHYLSAGSGCWRR